MIQSQSILCERFPYGHYYEDEAKINSFLNTKFSLLEENK